MTGTSYSKIYKRAITEFKDPTLKNLLENNTIMFSKVMYNFLENAISMFTNPIPVQIRLAKRQSPKDYYNYFLGDGVKATFTLTDYPDEEYIEDCIFEYKVDNNNVSGTYNPQDNSVTLDLTPPEGISIEVDIYYVGNWDIELYPMEEYILAEFIVAAWSEYIQNDKLDIIRLLGDTDFKLSSVANTTTSKYNWNIVNRETATKKMNKFAWDAQIQRLYK